MGNFQYKPQSRLAAGAAVFNPHQREIGELDRIIKTVASSDSAVRKAYAQSLKVSLEAYSSAGKKDVVGRAIATTDQILVMLSDAQSSVSQKYSSLCKALEAEEPRAKWMKAAHLWPCTSTYSMLETLRSISGCLFGARMKQALVDWAEALSQLQRILRMKDAVQNTTLTKVAAEQKNKGHGNWLPIDHPDWLLFELDANLLLRDQQVTVARATIQPESGSNALLQLNCKFTCHSRQRISRSCPMLTLYEKAVKARPAVSFQSLWHIWPMATTSFASLCRNL